MVDNLYALDTTCKPSILVLHAVTPLRQLEMRGHGRGGRRLGMMPLYMLSIVFAASNFDYDEMAAY